jgi:hypothetical protein
VAMVNEVSQLNEAITALSNAVADSSNIGPTASRVTKLVADLNRLYDKRKDAIVSPDLLSQAEYAPPAAPAPTSGSADAGAASASDVANDPDAVG